MLITDKREIDLLKWLKFAAPIYAVQDDTNTRCLAISLYTGKVAWEIPDGVTAAVRYRKKDGTSGLYDTLPDGESAYTIDGNTITVTLAPQVLTVAGKVDVAVALYSGTTVLGTFPFTVEVAPNPAGSQSISNNYYYLQTWDDVNAAIGALSELGTEDKSSLVAAINELLEKNVSIASIETTASAESGGTNFVQINMTDGTAYLFTVNNGEAGADGKSAYNSAVEAGYEGTEAEFSESLATIEETANTLNTVFPLSENLFNKETVTDGYYQMAAGTLTVHESSAISDFIAVEGGQTYTRPALAGYFYYGTYDSDKNFLARLNAYQKRVWTFDSDVAYIRISMYNMKFPDEFMFVKGSVLPDDYVPYGRKLNNDLLPATIDIVKITKNSDTSLAIQTGKGTHELTLQTSTSKNLYTWRLTKGLANDCQLWSEVDVEGPIKQKDVSDFMTGYHGDEQMTAVTMLIDGVLTDITSLTDGSTVECKNFTVCVVSDVYYDGDSENKAFTRAKRLVFEGNKVQIYNTYEFVGTSSIDIDIATGTGLYPASTDYVHGYVTNTGNTYISEATTNRNKNMDTVSFFGDDFTINLRVLSGKGENYYGVVYYYADQQRYKAYFYQQYANGADYLTLNTGDKLYSGYEIEFV